MNLQDLPGVIPDHISPELFFGRTKAEISLDVSRAIDAGHYIFSENLDGTFSYLDWFFLEDAASWDLRRGKLVCKNGVSGSLKGRPWVIDQVNQNSGSTIDLAVTKMGIFRQAARIEKRGWGAIIIPDYDRPDFISAAHGENAEYTEGIYKEYVGDDVFLAHMYLGFREFWLVEQAADNYLDFSEDLRGLTDIAFLRVCLRVMKEIAARSIIPPDSVKAFSMKLLQSSAEYEGDGVPFSLHPQRGY